jgi:hypothetical protein
VLSHAGRVYGTARRVIAQNGNTMTITFRRENAPEATINNVSIYEKVQQ